MSRIKKEGEESGRYGGVLLVDGRWKEPSDEEANKKIDLLTLKAACYRLVDWCLRLETKRMSWCMWRVVDLHACGVADLDGPMRWIRLGKQTETDWLIEN